MKIWKILGGIYLFKILFGKKRRRKERMYEDDFVLHVDLYEHDDDCLGHYDDYDCDGYDDEL